MSELNGGDKLVDHSEKVHHFPVNTPQGPGMMKLAHALMTRCLCGSDRFEKQYHVGWVKTTQIGAPAMSIEAPVMVCVMCGLEALQTHPKVGDKKLDGAYPAEDGS